MKILVFLLVSLIALVSAGPPCHWLGHAPICFLFSPWKCEPGYFEVTTTSRPEYAVGIFTKFGQPCDHRTWKTLCCENGFTGEP